MVETPLEVMIDFLIFNFFLSEFWMRRSMFSCCLYVNMGNTIIVLNLHLTNGGNALCFLKNVTCTDWCLNLPVANKHVRFLQGALPSANKDERIDVYDPFANMGKCSPSFSVSNF